MEKSAFVIITPVRDEVRHVHETIQAVKAQTVVPAQWILVDDGSTDGTGPLLDRHAAETPWMRVIHRPNRGRRSAGTGVMEAFYLGYSAVTYTAWDYLVKLDGDLSFASDYFERCFALFDADPTLGIGGGAVCQYEHGVLRVDSKGDPPFHVRGATKIYRRGCWEAISPLVAAPGWDTIDEVHANHSGWTTQTFSDLIVVQHKPTGGAEGAFRNAFKNGRANYISGYHPAFMVAKCVRRSVTRPLVLGSVALFAGYLSGYLKGIPQAAQPQVIRYLRRQQVRRLLHLPSIYARP
jgi:glycosyltransferase involved in cell wall biosynthesis